jgi:hypothetical protein
MMEDHRGMSVTGANAQSLALYEKAIAQFNCYVGDPVATLGEAIAESPSFPMAHALKAYLLLTTTEKDLVPEAAAAASRLGESALDERERAHADAVRSLLDGDLHAASRKLDRISFEHPHDIVALQVGHMLDFFVGDARNLRDRVGRVLPEWNARLPGYHALLGMHAFGLEECGAYGAAEDAGRRAVELNPQDGWAHHAVAHVMEMQGRAEEGISWLAAGAERWAPGSFLAVHNWWHLALFRLEHDDIAGTLELYDGAIRGGVSPVILEMIDASALLWRLYLRGADAGGRWQAIADGWAPHADDGFYAFNDVHAMMAFLGAERMQDAHRLLAAMRSAAAMSGSNRAMTAEVGLPLAQALMDFHQGRYQAVTQALLPLRTIAHRFGGSHAQRDVIDLTLIEAAQRSGNAALVRALANERLQHKPDSPLARRYRSRETVLKAA